jgi:hypothetical protein
MPTGSPASTARPVRGSWATRCAAPPPTRPGTRWPRPSWSPGRYPSEIGGYPTVGPESEDITLIFDVDTGALLHYEATTPAGSSENPPVPSLYESYVESAWVDAFGDRP